MTLPQGLESAGLLLSVLTPLVAVPLTLITFYLRSVREHQMTLHTELERRMAGCEASAEAVRRALTDVEREYTTKEEWLRECLQTRRVLEQLTATSIRIETLLQGNVKTPKRQNAEIAQHRAAKGENE